MACPKWIFRARLPQDREARRAPAHAHLAASPGQRTLRSLANPLLWLDAGLPHQLRPLRLIITNEPREFIGRITARVSTNGLHACSDFLIGQDAVGIGAELFHG